VHGAAVKIMETARGLSRLGATVEVVTNDRLWYYHVVRGKVARRRYPQALLSATNLPPLVKQVGARLQLPGYWDGLRWILSRIGYPLDEQFLYQAMVDPDFWLRVLYVGWRYRIEVYQAEFPGYAVPAWIAARTLGGRCALVEHNVEYLRLRDTTEIPSEVIARFRLLERFVARLMDHVIVVSEPDRDRVHALGVPLERVQVIPHGVDLNAFEFASGVGIRARYRVPEDAFLLVFHGTLNYWPNTVAVKRIAEELLPRLERLGVTAHVLVCGANPPRYYAHPRIVFTDVVQDLPAHLAAADLAVVPLEDGGGTRLKILEYFAAGLPVVSTPKGAEGIPVRPGQEIEIASDWDTFARSVARLFHDPERSAMLARSGRAFVQALDWNHVCRAYLDCYRKPIPGTDRGGSASGKPLDHGTGRATSGANVDEQARCNSRTEPERVPTRATGTRARDRATLDPMEVAMAHLPGNVVQRVRPTMIMNVVEACNLSCVFCDQGGGSSRMDTVLAHRLLDEAAALGTETVVFTGGEPLLHPDLWDLVDRASRAGMGTNVTTNGLLVSRQIDRIVDSGVGSVSVSLDGLEAVHDNLRGVPGTFSRAVEAVKQLRDRNVAVQVYFVVTNRNVHQLLAVHELATSLGAGFEFWPVNGMPRYQLRDDDSRRIYREAVDTLARHDPRHAERKQYYLTGLEYHAGWDRAVRCLGLVQQFGVTVSGKLLPCCVWQHEEMAVGDLRRHGLIDLWTGPEADAFRKRLVREGCRNGCYNHSLHEFERVTGESFLVP